MKKVSMKKNWDNPRENSMPAIARVPASVEIGGVLVAPATVLAPMAGVTDTVFRRFIRNASVFSGQENGGSAYQQSAVGLRFDHDRVHFG
jgi:tRNA-dihydrouridine synthase B